MSLEFTQKLSFAHMLFQSWMGFFLLLQNTEDMLKNVDTFFSSHKPIIWLQKDAMSYGMILQCFHTDFLLLSELHCMKILNEDSSKNLYFVFSCKK